MLHIPELEQSRAERLKRSAASARRALRRLLAQRETLRAAAAAALTTDARRFAELRIRNVEMQIARQALKRQEAEDRLTAIEALADCSHTRPQERPRTHRRIEAPELWR